MTPAIYALPFDATRTLPRNRMLREYHDLSDQANLPYRVLVLDHGYFYTHEMEIEDSMGFKLTQEVDYQCVGASAEAMKLTGFEVCSVVVILNPRVFDQVYVTASMVGGIYCDVTPALANISAGTVNNRNPIYKDITNKPDAFEVGGHLHAMWELYGFQGQCAAIDRIRMARLAGSARKYNDILDDFNKRIDDLLRELNSSLGGLDDHLRASNPHRVTPAQIGLSDLANYPIITEAEANTPGFNSPQRYLTVGRYRQMLQVGITDEINNHVNDDNNPHKVTGAQIGTLSKAEFDAAATLRLNKSGRVKTTRKVLGYDWNSLYTYSRAGLSANQITEGIVDMRRLVNGAWPGGYCFKLTGSCISNPPDGNSYIYEPFSFVSVPIASGDKLVYDLWCDQGVFAGIDAQWGPEVMRDALRFYNPFLTDQNGIIQHPAAPEIPKYASRRWYTRIIDLTRAAGRTLYKWNLGIENDGLGTYSAYVRNVRIEKANGEVKAWVFNENVGSRDTKIVSDLTIGYVSSKVYGNDITAGSGLSSDQIVVGNNMTINMRDAMLIYAQKGTKLVYLINADGTNILTTLQNTYNDLRLYPAGTLAFVMTRYTGSWVRGSRTETRDAQRLDCWVKLSDTEWTLL